MESRQKNKIAIYALIVSILSLAMTIIMAIYQYKENIEIVVDTVKITDINLDSYEMDCQFDIIIANTSHSTTSLLRSKGYKTYSGFRASKELKIWMEPSLPITLIQGGAEKITMKCQYLLDDEEAAAIKSGKTISDVLDGHWVSIRLYTAKNHIYYANAKLGDA